MQQELPFGVRPFEPTPQLNLTKKDEEEKAADEDVLTAYLDLALRIYLRTKDEKEMVSKSEHSRDLDREF
jgi:hypothetical protein